MLRSAGVRASITGCGMGQTGTVLGLMAAVAPDRQTARILVNGLRLCRSARCPGCAPAVARIVAGKVRAMLRAARRKDMGVVFLTLTVAHHPNSLLRTLRDDLGKGFHDIQHGRPWKRLKINGLAGIARVWDLTGGVTGWHLHPHILAFHKDGTEAALAAARELAATWMRLMEGRGYKVSIEAQDVRAVETDDKLAGYGVEALQTWGPEAEMAAGHAKQGKRPDRFTLPQILNRALAGDEWAIERFAEAVKALSGQRILVIGKSLRAALEIEEADEEGDPGEEGADEGPEPEAIGTMSAATWNRALDECLTPRVLDMIEAYAIRHAVPWSRVWPMIDDYVWRAIEPPPP